MVKNISSILGSIRRTLRASANIRVKCPNPTPLVGKKTIDFLGPPLSIKSDSSTGCDLRPRRSKPIEQISQGSVRGRRGNRQGCSMERIRCTPTRKEVDFLIRTTSRRYLSSAVLLWILMSQKMVPFLRPYYWQ